MAQDKNEIHAQKKNTDFVVKIGINTYNQKQTDSIGTK